MRVQVKRTFKSYYSFLSKKNKKAERFCMKFSSTPNTSVQQMSQSAISKSAPSHSVATLFQRISQPPGQDQQYSKRTKSRLTP